MSRSWQYLNVRFKRTQDRLDMKSFFVSGKLLFLAVFLWASMAQATTVINVPLEQMAKESTVIVHGRVEAQQVVQEAGSDRILTLTAVEVLTEVKGLKKNDIVTIYQVGGTLDGQTLHVSGALKFRKGEEFILFGVRFRDMIVSYGMGLGKYMVMKHSGDTFVLPEFGDVHRVEPDGKGGYQSANHKFPDPETLDSFIERVRALSARAGGTK